MEPSVVRQAAVQAPENLQLLSEALLSGIELEELGNEACIEEEFAINASLELPEGQSEEKQQEKLCETIAPEL